MISSLVSGRLARTSSSHSSRKAISLLLLASSGKLECWKNSTIASTLLDFTHAVSKLAFAQEDRRLRPCVHHQHIGSKLLKILDNLLPLAMLVDESEEIEISLSVADYSSKFIELKEADVAVVILNTCLLRL